MTGCTTFRNLRRLSSRGKAHIMRSVNQECAKQDLIAKLDQTSCLLVIDWAMKFLQLRYIERSKVTGKEKVG